MMPRFYGVLSRLRLKYNLNKNAPKDEANESFIGYRENTPIQPAVKIIAFYFSQPYIIAETNLGVRRFLTQYIAVMKKKFYLKPQSTMHFERYDLDDPTAMKRQIQLARNYGVSGFSYSLHWHDGALIMSKSLQKMLKNNAIDMPFCLAWNNANLTEKDYNRLDSAALLRYILKIFRDKRYISMENKPVFIIYKANDIPNIQNIVKLWRIEAETKGLPGLYLVTMQEKNISSAAEIGFDALIEAPLQVFNQEKVFDYKEAVQALIQNPASNFKSFKSVSLSSNAAADGYVRKRPICYNFSLNVYKQWLSYNVNKIYHSKEYTAGEKIIFINAWNNWEGGAHLEPDEEFGYGYLQTTYDVLKNYDEKKLYSLAIDKPQKKNNYAVVLHLFFDELWPEICRYLDNFKEINFDLYVSVTSIEVGFKVKQNFPNAYIHLAENRGRDILPFIEILPVIESMDYTAVCKIHSKFTMQAMNVGKTVREALFNGLLGSHAKISNIVSMFSEDKKLGMLVPKTRLLTISQYMFPNEMYFNTLCQLLGLDDDKNHAEYVFPAGSMFWFNPQALTGIKEIKDYFFELESGATDGKVEHAVERVFCLIAKKQGYRVASC